MRITFKKTEIHNFRCFADEVFEFDKHVGLNLICGKNNDIPGSKNGSGKSSILSALVFSLFGQTQDNIRNCNIANKFVKSKEVKVTTWFDVDSQSYKVISGHNKYGQPYCQLLQLKDGEEVDITKSTMTETRKYICDEVLHCDLSIFLRTVILSSDQNYNFFRLRKGEKKEFIEKLFDISVFGDMYNQIHRDILEQDKALLVQQNKLMVLNKNQDDYQQRLEAHDKRVKEKIAELQESLSLYQKKKEEIRSLNLESNSEEAAHYESVIEKLNQAADMISSKMLDLSKKSQKVEVAIHKCTTLKDTKQKAIDKHSELLSKLCNDCKSVFSDYYSITSYMSDIAELDKKIAALSKEASANDSAAKALSEKKQQCSDKLSAAQSKVRQLTEEYVKAQQKVSQIDMKLAAVENEIAKLEKEENPYADLHHQTQIELDQETKALAAMSEKYKYLKFAESIVSQDTLRKFIISDLIGLLNNKIKLYLTRLGAKYSVVFDSDMNYTFMTEAGEYEYDNFSSGERARLMIAACFAFRDFMYIRNSLSSNILILDEFIDGAIDSIAIESILDILKDFSQLWKQNIYIVSHRKEVNNDIFDNIIQVVKTDNISKITYL